MLLGKRNYYLKIKKEEKGLKVTLILAAAYIVIFTSYSILKHYTFKTYAYDLGIYCQALCTFLKGRLFYETPDLIHNPSGSFFGVHFSPILFLIAPVFAAYPHAETLLLVQSLALGLAAIPIYLLSRYYNLPQELSVILALSYLLHPFTQSANLYDFHPHSFIPFFILLSFLFIERKKYGKATIFLILTSSTIEAAPIICAFSLLGITLREKLQTGYTDKKLLILLTIQILFFIIGINIMDIFAPCPLKSLSIPFLMRKIGSTPPSEAVNYILTGKILTIILHDMPLKIAYWAIALAFVLFIPLLNIVDFFGAIPWLVYTLTTTYQCLYLPGFQYGAFVLGPLYYATITGIAKLGRTKKFSFIPEIILKKKLIFVSTFILLSLALGPLSPAINAFGSAYTKPDLHLQSNALYEAILQVPKDHSLFTQVDVFPHVCCRENVYVWLPEHVLPQWILLDFKLEGIKTPAWNVTPIKKTQELLLMSNYRIAFMKDGVVLWVMRDVNVTSTTIFQRDQYPVDLTKLVPVNARIKLNNSRPVLESEPNITSGQTLWYGPYMALPPGKYVIKFSNMSLNGCLKLIFLASLPNKKEDRLLQASVVCGNGMTGEYSLNLTIPGPVEDFEVVGVALTNFRHCSIGDITMNLVSMGDGDG